MRLLFIISKKWICKWNLCYFSILFNSGTPSGGLMTRVCQLRKICERNQKKKIYQNFLHTETDSLTYVCSLISGQALQSRGINEEPNTERGRTELLMKQIMMKRKKQFSAVCNMCLWRYNIIGDHFLCQVHYGHSKHNTLFLCCLHVVTRI